MKKTTKSARKQTAKKPASGTVQRNKWFSAKKVRVRSTSKGPVIDIRQ